MFHLYVTCSYQIPVKLLALTQLEQAKVLRQWHASTAVINITRCKCRTGFQIEKDAHFSIPSVILYADQRLAPSVYCRAGRAKASGLYPVTPGLNTPYTEPVH